MKTNTLDIRHMDCMALMAELPDKSQHLIIVDPPYFEVKGGFDFIWASFEDYLKDVEKWAKEMKRVLADNGTLFWWGHAKKIAYGQVILDKYFKLENHAKWEKIECQNRRQDFSESRCFATVTEHLLIYSNETDGMNLADLNYTLQMGKKHTEIMEPIISYMIGEMVNAGFNCGMVNEYLETSMASHWFSRTSQWALPTPKAYQRLQELFNYKHLRKDYKHLRKDYEELRKDYEELRKDYEELRRPFNNDMKLTDVLLFSQEAHETGKHNHPTQKPPTLCRALIRTCSKRGMNLLVPFMGSGTECVEGANLGLNVTASELDEDYYKAACERIHRETSQQTFEL